MEPYVGLWMQVRVPALVPLLQHRMRYPGIAAGYGAAGELALCAIFTLLACEDLMSF